MPLLPYVRREIFLQAIKNRDASALPDPNNREELFLKAIAEDVALIPYGVSVILPAAVSEMLANLPEAHTHTELFYKEILDTILIATTITDTTPYISRETAGGLPVFGTAELNKKLGNTVAMNQLVDATTTSVTIPSGHKYYAVINGTASIGTSNGTAIAVTGGQDIVIDLSLWYGSTDRIPAHLLSHPEDWGRYYAGSLAYAAGYLDSADGSVLKSKGADGTTVLAEVDTGSEVLRSAGTVADEKTPDGMITRRIGVVDLGTLTWTMYEGSSATFFYRVISDARTTGKSPDSGICARYVGASSVSAGDKIFTWNGNQLRIRDDSYTDAATFKAAMSGVYLVYELATPTTEQGSLFDPTYGVEYGGTESWTNLKGIPQGHETEYKEYTT